MFQFRDGDMGASRPLADVITDFSKADHEKIQLNLVDADTATAGDQAFSFIGAGAFTGTAGELRYKVIAGDTWISADTNGDGAADWYIGLTGVHGLHRDRLRALARPGRRRAHRPDHGNLRSVSVTARPVGSR